MSSCEDICGSGRSFGRRSYLNCKVGILVERHDAY